ncbi:MAG: hypothetical protein CL927_03645 [Deltaproteobacteria bacterium]|nr:hypothetical protein [Deltaproteobacteria bacterium]HCH67020.1 hypothetical protein [Deltaproteobacteria bacterium]
MTRSPTPMRIALLLLVSLALVGLWWMHGRSRIDGSATRPSETRRGRFLHDQQPGLALRRMLPSSPPSTVQQANGPSVVHRVFVSRSEVPLTEWRFQIDTGVAFGPQEYWPAFDEAPWPDLDSAHSIQVLAEALRNNHDQTDNPLLDFITDAEADGLFEYDAEADVEDPWTALLAMQAAHARAWLSATGTGIEHAQSNEIAEAIVADWPNDPAAEYARLHLLQVANDTGSKEHDPSRAVERVLDLIEYTEDPLVLEVAMSELGRIQSVPMSPDTLQRIAEALPEVDPDIQESIAILGMNQTVRQGLWQQASHWSSIYRDLVAVDCPPSAVAHNERCAYEMQALGAFEARRARETGALPTTWQGELSMVVKDCVLAGVAKDALAPPAPSVATVLESTGTWEDPWLWSNWTQRISALATHPAPLDHAQSLSDCLDSHDWQMEPDDALFVQLVVYLQPEK